MVAGAPDICTGPAHHYVRRESARDRGREPCLPELHLAEILPFILVGFAAQLVDGALGMAFGVISSTLLVSLRRAARGGLGERPRGRGVHHRRLRDQPCPAQERELAAVPRGSSSPA